MCDNQGLTGLDVIFSVSLMNILEYYLSLYALVVKDLFYQSDYKEGIHLFLTRSIF